MSSPLFSKEVLLERAQMMTAWLQQCIDNMERFSPEQPQRRRWIEQGKRAVNLIMDLEAAAAIAPSETDTEKRKPA